MARISTLLFIAIFVCISDTVKAGPIGYTLRNNMLARFDLDAPGTVTTVGTISGAVSFLTSIDFRPADGLLYGYDPVTTRIVTVNPTNAFTTFVSIPTIPSRNPFMGMDFNPVADRLRLVNTDNQNLRIDVSTGATIADGRGNTGYAILRRFGFYELRRIDLATGLATNLGQLGDGSTYRGLAIVQQAVPEPSSAMIALGLFVMGVGSSARRRRV